MTFKTFKQIVDNNDVSLLRERIVEISTGGWQKISREMTFTLDEIREFADHIDWYTYVGRMDWNDMLKHIEFENRDSRLKNALEKYKRRKEGRKLKHEMVF